MDTNQYVKAVNDAYEHMHSDAKMRVALLGILTETTQISVNLGHSYLLSYLSAREVQEHLGKLFQHAILLGIVCNLPLDETLQKNIDQLPK